MAGRIPQELRLTIADYVALLPGSGYSSQAQRWKQSDYATLSELETERQPINHPLALDWQEPESPQFRTARVRRQALGALASTSRVWNEAVKPQADAHLRLDSVAKCTSPANVRVVNVGKGPHWQNSDIVLCQFTRQVLASAVNLTAIRASDLYSVAAVPAIVACLPRGPSQVKEVQLALSFDPWKDPRFLESLVDATAHAHSIDLVFLREATASASVTELETLSKVASSSQLRRLSILRHAWTHAIQRIPQTLGVSPAPLTHLTFRHHGARLSATLRLVNAAAATLQHVEMRFDTFGLALELPVFGAPSSTSYPSLRTLIVEEERDGSGAGQAYGVDGMMSVLPKVISLVKAPRLEHFELYPGVFDAWGTPQALDKIFNAPSSHLKLFRSGLPPVDNEHRLTPVEVEIEHVRKWEARGIKVVLEVMKCPDEAWF